MALALRKPLQFIYRADPLGNIYIEWPYFLNVYTYLTVRNGADDTRVAMADVEEKNRKFLCYKRLQSISGWSIAAPNSTAGLLCEKADNACQMC